MSKVELYEAIRKANREEGLGVRALVSRFHVHRRNVREALASATPPQRKVPERLSPALGPYRETIREWLTADLSAPHNRASQICYSCRMDVASRDLRNNTRALLDRVRRGETITITVDGLPAAVLAPLVRRPRWLRREEFAGRIMGHQADAELARELRNLAPETTDDLSLQ